VVLGVEEERNSVTDVSTDVAGAVYQLTAWADLDRMSRGGTGGCRNTGGCRLGSTGDCRSTGRCRIRSSVGRFRYGSIVITNAIISESLGHRHSDIC